MQQQRLEPKRTSEQSSPFWRTPSLMAVRNGWRDSTRTATSSSQPEPTLSRSSGRFDLSTWTFPRLRSVVLRVIARCNSINAGLPICTSAACRSGARQLALCPSRTRVTLSNGPCGCGGLTRPICSARALRGATSMPNLQLRSPMPFFRRTKWPTRSGGPQALLRIRSSWVPSSAL